MSQNATLEDLWTSVKTELSTMFPRDVFETWFEPIGFVNGDDKEIVLSAPNDFSVIWIQDNYLDLIGQHLSKSVGHRVKTSIKAAEETPLEASSRQIAPTASGRVDTTRLETQERKPAHNRTLLLNPRYTFENFIVGSSNQLAHAASMAVANAPAKSYNPLFLYGESGLGKTHLMHAVAHSILDSRPEARVVYVSCEKFTNEFIQAIQDGNLINFRKSYRNVDVLLIDDVHFLTGKERIQEEFFHTFNELFESQKQICLSSDRPAGEIAKLESRLLSRFQWGMVTDIQAPDLETRVAILSKKAAAQGQEIPGDVLEFLAQRITRNVRRMEGALTRVSSYAKLIQKRLDIPTVERLLQDILLEEAQVKITIEMIQNRVSEYFHLRIADMTSKRRPSNIAFPRQIAMYLSRIHTNHSLQEIGAAFGGRDHGTVIHACKTVENMMEQDPTTKRNVEFLTKQLAG